MAPNLGGTWSELYTSPAPTDSANRGGAVVLPDSTTRFRLDSTVSTNQMTISSWIYWNGNAGGTVTSPAGIASTFNGANTSGWSFRINSDGTLRFNWVQSAGGSRNRTTTSSVVTAGQWINTTLVFDSTIAQPVAFYVNGVAVASSGSAGDPLMGTLLTSTNTIALGIGQNDNGVGRMSLNGYMDDYAMWDTALSAAKIKALNTAPVVLEGYNAGVLNNLFTAYDAQSSTTVDSIGWSYATLFDLSGKNSGDTWLGDDGKYYMWLDGASNNASGLIGVASVPEPAGGAMLVGAGVLVFIAGKRRRR